MWSQVKEALNQSTARFLTRLADLLPGIVALIVALLVSVVLAGVVAWIVKRALMSFQFDERLSRWGATSVADWSPRRSPSLLVSRGVGCLVILTGVLIGIAAFDADTTSLLVRSVFAYMPNLVGAILVLLIGTIVGRFLSRSVLIGAVNLNLHYARLLSIGAKWLVYVLTVAMALEHLRIAPGIVELAFGILFGGIVLALALAVGLGSKELVTKSLERDVRKVSSSETIEEPFRHI
jgi:hypothetical protein